MDAFIVYALIVLTCALGTDAGLANIAADRGIDPANKEVLADMRDLGVECTPGSKYRYADNMCRFLECKENKYELAECNDGLGVTEGFKKADSSMTNPCSRNAPECRKSLADKGVVDQVVQACGIDLCFIVDMSYSISDINKVKVRSFIINLARSLKLGGVTTFLAGLTYGAETHPFIKFSSYNSAGPMVTAVRNMEVKPKKGTATNLALQEAREVLLITENGRRKGKNAVCIVMTDGVTYPIEDSPNTIAEAKRLKDPKSYEDGVSPPKVLLVELPNSKESSKETSAAEKATLADTKLKEFEAIPSDSESHFKLKSFDDLENIVQSVLKKSCMTL